MTTLLVDAHNLAYRAWFNREQREDPAAAATIFVQALMAEAEALAATRKIAAVERSRSFRFRLFAGYKAGRKERTPELKAFIDSLPVLAHQAGYEVWHSPDHEADDVMATFAQQLDGEVLIVTTDRDLCGCVTERVKVALPGEKDAVRVILDADHIRQTFGVAPSGIPFYKALIGDPSDGIPGVKGLGKVKAAPLLQRFDSLDSLYNEVGTLDPGLQALLGQTPREEVELYYRLTTLVTSAPLERLLLEENAVPALLTPAALTTPAWGISWHQLAEGSPSSTSVEQILSFMNRFPPPPEVGSEEWTEDWRNETADLDLDLPSSFGWCLNVLADPDCPPEVLDDLSLFRDSRLDRMIAWHRHCPPALLKRYQESGNAEVSKGAQLSPERPWMQPDLTGCTEQEASQFLRLDAGSQNDLAFHLARNPTTPAALLETLSRHDDVAVRLALASRAWPAHPQAAHNLLNDPQLSVRETLAANPHAPADLLEQLATDRIEVQRALAGNTAITVKTQALLAEMDDSSVRSALAVNPSFTQLWKLSGVEVAQRLRHPLVRHLHFWQAWDTPHAHLEVCRQTARHAVGGLPYLSRLVGDHDLTVRVNLARNPACPAPLLTKLAQDSSPAVRRAVALHSACPGDIRDQLKLDPHWHVRRAAAQDISAEITPRIVVSSHSWMTASLMASHPSCPPDVLHALATQSDDWRVRLAAGRHAACPVSALRHLAEEASWTSRVAAAGNPQTPPETLIRLARDTHLDVRVWVAAQAACPPEVLHELASDPTWEVRLAAAARLERPSELLEQLARDTNKDVRKAAAQNPSTPGHVLDHLLGDTSEGVKHAVVFNPSCPEGILRRLGNDGHWQVREAVATHPQVPDDLLERLSEDPDDDVRAAVSRHFRATPDQHRRLSEAEECKVRQAVASHPKCPPDVLAALAHDDDKQVRAAVARNHQAASRIEGNQKEDADLGFLDDLVDDDELHVSLNLLYQPEHRRPPGLHERLAAADDLGPWLAKHLDVPIDVLARYQSKLLAGSYVNLAQRADLSPDLIEWFADEPEAAADLMNALHVPLEVVEELDLSASRLACRIYARQVGMPSDAWLRLPPELTPLFWELALTPDVAGPLMYAAVTSRDWELREAAASHPNLPPQWLTELGRDQDSDVRLAVAANPRTPPGVLLSLLQSGLEGKDEICTVLASHPGLPEKGMFELLQKTEEQDVLLELAKNTALPGPAQLFLAGDTRPDVRAALQANPALTTEARLRLSAF